MALDMEWLSEVNQSLVVTLLAVALFLTIAMFVEMLAPRRPLSGSLSWRWANNLSLSLITWYISTLAAHAVYQLLSKWTTIHSVGLFQQFESGFWLPLVTLIFVGQFLAYLTHLAFHNIGWLWPIHAVHHSDTEIDATTSYRHHPLEPLVFLPLISPMILLLGVPLEATFTYQIVLIGLTIFTHTNMNIPQGIDRWLRLLIVTPDFHRVHHSAEKQFTNSNYGTAVPWFDYIFGTAKNRGREEKYRLGLEYSRDEKSSRLDQMILHPPVPPKLK